MTSFAPGGTERQMIELVRRLDRDRWNIHLACFRAEGAWFHRAADVATSVAEFPVNSFKSIEFVRQVAAFAQWCLRAGIAVVHTTAMPSNIFGLTGAALARVPVRVGNRREINPDKAPLDIAMQRAAYACAHRIVANSRAAAERLREERVPGRKIVVIPNGLDTSRSRRRPPRTPLRTITVVANLRREKGHDVLLAAAPQVLARFPDARFAIVGGGPEQSALMARADAPGIRGAFTFHGHCDEVAQRLDEADVFVLPSRSEAFPNAVLEAMAAGLPIVASSVGGIRELLDHGQTGLLVPPDNSRALADALCQVMADPALAARLGASARARAETRYSFDRMVGAFEAVYLSELTRRGVVAAPGARLTQTAVS
jgi:glycosyltransferase involved in cell wall biosynthesis